MSLSTKRDKRRQSTDNGIQDNEACKETCAAQKDVDVKEKGKEKESKEKGKESKSQ
jgi:hypothetical protein